jgi:hypothetical protein
MSSSSNLLEEDEAGARADGGPVEGVEDGDPDGSGAAVASVPSCVPLLTGRTGND